jgi:hypothetical protein
MHTSSIHGLPGCKVDYYEALARIRFNERAHRCRMRFLPVISSRRLETEFDLAVLTR